MRFLHTSDWHLGKIFHERPLIEDQKYFLDQIIQQILKGEVEGNPYSALLVPGDVYDRAVPSAEASQLLSNFLAEINSKFPDVHLFFISGNHDSASRLSFAAPFFNAHNIHIITDTKDYTLPVVIQKGDEKVCVYQLPFLQPLSIKSAQKDEDGDEVLLRSQDDLYKEACKNIEQAHSKNYEDLPSVICAHLFTSGSLLSKSERSNVGTAEQVDVSVFNHFSYGAFGHIHKKQSCDKEHKCWYSGSPLAYNFDDNPDTVMLDVEVFSDGKIEVKDIPIKSLHPIVKLEGKFEDFYGSNADSKKWKQFESFYVQIILTDEVHVNNSYEFLKSVFPHLLFVTRQEKRAGESSSSIIQRKEAIDSKEPEKIFNQFLTDVYGDQLEDSELVLKEKLLMKEEAAKLNWGDAQ